MIIWTVSVAALLALGVLWFWNSMRGDACACGYARREDCACIIRRIERRLFGG